MKRRFSLKKAAALLLTLLLLVNVTACGGDPAPTTPPAAADTPMTQPTGWYTEGAIALPLSQVQAIVGANYTTPKNVIVIIGDGMGPNDLVLAEKYADVGAYGLVVNQIPNHGLATTHSASDAVTDSAASATALSTGVKTNNGTIGKDPDGNDLKTMAETARENGKKVGIVTDDLMTGATPTAFTVHNASRNNTGELINAMVQFTPDVLIGKDYMNTYGPLDDTSRPIFNDTYLVAKDFDKFQKVLDTDPTCQKPFMGFLNGYSSVASYQLAQAAQVAFKRLQNDKGFFLMIESCGTDKYGANNNMTGKLNSVVTLDRAVAAALLFMQDNPDTLLIVTSDHETGGVQIPAEGADPDTAFTTKEHTDTPVRVFALGAGAEYFHNKTVDNTDIAKFVMDALRGG